MNTITPSSIKNCQHYVLLTDIHLNFPNFTTKRCQLQSSFSEHQSSIAARSVAVKSLLFNRMECKTFPIRSDTSSNVFKLHVERQMFWIGLYWVEPWLGEELFVQDHLFTFWCANYVARKTSWHAEPYLLQFLCSFNAWKTLLDYIVCMRHENIVMKWKFKPVWLCWKSFIILHHSILYILPQGKH